MERAESLLGRRPRELDCVFCPDSLAASTSEFDETVAETGEAFIMPALGMMVPGYFLAVSRNHVQSFAHLTPVTVTAFYDWVIERCRAWTPLFGPYLIVEHGSCPGARSGSCIDHAHLHLVPLANQIGHVLLAEPGVNWTPAVGASVLADKRDSGYVSLHYGGDLFIADDVCLPSQWLRRIIARELALPVWDWALDFGRPNLSRTMARLSDLPATTPRFAV